MSVFHEIAVQCIREIGRGRTPTGVLMSPATHRRLNTELYRDLREDAKEFTTGSIKELEIGITKKKGTGLTLTIYDSRIAVDGQFAFTYEDHEHGGN